MNLWVFSFFFGSCSHHEVVGDLKDFILVQLHHNVVGDILAHAWNIYLEKPHLSCLSHFKYCVYALIS